MATATDKLIAHWRAIGPVAWAEGRFGWVDDDGLPITLAPWQRAVLEAWWERRESVSTLAVSSVKKTGKTFVNAVLTAWRWLALPGEHFCCANDLDQSAGRQFQEIAQMVRQNTYLAANVTITKSQLVFEPTGSTLTALPADYAGASGANFITSSHTEAQAILYEDGRRMWEEMTPIPGRFYGLPCLRVVDSYAGFEGESKTWHDLVDRGLAGARVSDDWPIYQNGGLLLFHAEGAAARASCFRGTPGEAAGYYAEQKESLRPNAFTRMHENRRTANESRFVSKEAWDDCFSLNVVRWTKSDGRRLVLGADASTSRDLTALVGCTWNDTTKKVEAVLCRVWRPERNKLRAGKPTVDLDETIGDEVLYLHELGVVVVVLFDPYQLHSVAMRWRKAGITCAEMVQNQRRIEADQSLYDAILGHKLEHYGDPILTEHVLNAVAVETPRGFRLAKEKTSRKIDAAVALSMSHFGTSRRGAKLSRQQDESESDETPGTGAAHWQKNIVGNPAMLRLARPTPHDIARAIVESTSLRGKL